MAIIGVPSLSAPGIPADPTRPRPVRDPLLSGVANSGVRFMADLAFPYCYPGGAPTGRPAAAAPTNGAVVQDMTDLANGSVVIPAGTVGYAGGGFDFTNAQGVGAAATWDVGIQMPASVLSDIYTAFGGKSQRYLFTCWVKLPALADWNASGTLLAFAGDRSYLTDVSLFVLSMKAGGLIDVRREVAANTADTTTMTIQPAAGDYGTVVQIAFWRADSGQGLRLRSANGTVLVTRAVGADNTQNFSTNQFTVGKNGRSFAGASGTAVLQALNGFRVYRAFMENLARSGRDPATVLDQDYTFVRDRAAFS